MNPLTQLPPRPRLDPVGVARVGRREVITFPDELDLATMPALDRAIDAALDRGALELWVDLSDTPFMDSAGVHCLFAAHGRCARLNRRLVVICDDGPVRRVLEMTGLDDRLTVCRSRFEARRLS